MGEVGVAAGGRRVAPHRLVDPAVRAVSHDLRQHVASIATLAEAALTEAGVSTTLRTLLTDIRREAAVMRDMCQTLAHRPRHPERLRLDRLARESVDALAAGGRRIALVEQTPALVEGDRLELRRVIENMLANACDAAGPHGAVTVTVAVDDGIVELAVIDDGPGWDPGTASVGMGTLIIDALAKANGAEVMFDLRSGDRTRLVLVMPQVRPADPRQPRPASQRPARSSS